MDRRIMILAAASLCGAAWADMAEAKAKAKAKNKLKLGLGDDDAQAGLREILTSSTAAAVSRVGRAGGYWDDPVIRIPLPKSLATVQRALKPVGMSGLLDDVHLRMNRAAESAAPVAKGLFIDAIKGMTIKDAVGIVRGGPTSGTDYLQRTTTPALTAAFTTPMENALQQTGAVEYLDRAIKRNNLQSVVKGDAKTWLGDYAVDFALTGLFHYVGVEETAIRKDPLKRTTQLLKSVFG